MLGWSEISLTTDDQYIQRVAMETVNREAQRQRVLIDELIDMSRILQGKLTLSYSPCDLQALVQHAVDALCQSTSLPQQRTDIDFPDQPIMVRADACRLTQCFTILLTNSIKYTPGDNTTRITCSQHGAQAQFVISDGGIGTTAEEMVSILIHFIRQAGKRMSAV